MKAELKILDKDFKLLAIIDEYESLIWTDRFRACGDFELSLSASILIRLNLASKWALMDRYLVSSLSDRTMIIQSYSISYNVERGAIITLKGESLESILKRRIVWGEKSYYLGNRRDIIYALLMESITNPSNEARKISNFVIGDISWAGHFISTVDYVGDNLYDAITGLCFGDGSDSSRHTNIGYKITLDGDNFIFSIYCGSDTYCKFSCNNEVLIDANYTKDLSNTKTAALIRGEERTEGEDENKITYNIWETYDYNTDSDYTGLKRCEVFVDAQSVASELKNGNDYYSSEFDDLASKRDNAKWNLDQAKNARDIWEEKLKSSESTVVSCRNKKETADKRLKDLNNKISDCEKNYNKENKTLNSYKNLLSKANKENNSDDIKTYKSKVEYQQGKVDTAAKKIEEAYQARTEYLAGDYKTAIDNYNTAWDEYQANEKQYKIQYAQYNNWQNLYNYYVNELNSLNDRDYSTKLKGIGESKIYDSQQSTDTVTVSIDPNISQYQYLRDYKLGDYAYIDYGFDKFPCWISEITYSEDSSGPALYPTFECMV